MLGSYNSLALFRHCDVFVSVEFGLHIIKVKIRALPLPAPVSSIELDGVTMIVFGIEAS